MGKQANLPSPPPIVVEAGACRDYACSSKVEWLETNGTGAFAMGTVAGANTRRYHGLLIASLRPPVERFVFLSRVEEDIVVDGAAYGLGACQYPGAAISADGRLEQFRLDPFPTWTYNAGGVRLEKRFFLVRDHQTAVLQYSPSADCRLRIRPFLAFRDYHSLTRQNASWSETVQEEKDRLRIRPYDSLPALELAHNAARFESGGAWYLNVEYLEELDRGLDFREDVWSPGVLEFDLQAGACAWIVATIEPGQRLNSQQISRLESAERRARRVTAPDPLVARLRAAADQFVVRRQDGSPTIIAGYPWFTDWGRDTMISLPGLLIATGRLDEARDILAGFLKHLKQGLIPNRFPDAGAEPEYNTVDGTLWMFPAVWAYMEAGGDKTFLRDVFYPAAKEILAWHRRGTLYDIKVDPADGLLSCGGGGQLTWMDARVGDWVVTPRHGKPVEINALFYNALRMTQAWAKRYRQADVAAECEAAASRLASSFNQAFWNPARQCLYDVVGPFGPDSRLRPNQIFAVSLPFPLLDEEKRRAVVRVVQSELLTPFGLRTLDPHHPEYRPHYRGGPLERDGSYHQGTVWPWLMGAFITAYLRACGRTEQSLEYCRGLALRLAEDATAIKPEGCLGQLAEIHDADPPHRRVGAVAQAWSVAELLRVLATDLR